MAYERIRAKGGMEGRTSQTERWMSRAEAKKASKKARRADDKRSASE